MIKYLLEQAGKKSRQQLKRQKNYKKPNFLESCFLWAGD
jgi:hypothetical protein